MRPSSFFSQLCQIALHGLCIFTFVALSVPLAANEPFLNKPSNEWTEAEAPQVLNDSSWAHTITTATQDTPCDYEHPAFPGLFREEIAQIADLRPTQFPAESVKPDGAEYLVRLVSVKPTQAAVERLISLDSLDEKWILIAKALVWSPAASPQIWRKVGITRQMKLFSWSPLSAQDPQGPAFSIMPLRIEPMVRHS
jgi:hypothetical protein